MQRLIDQTKAGNLSAMLDAMAFEDPAEAELFGRSSRLCGRLRTSTLCANQPTDRTWPHWCRRARCPRSNEPDAEHDRADDRQMGAMGAGLVTCAISPPLI